MTTQRSHKQLLGALILSEANNLKRTLESMAEELAIELSLLEAVARGESSMDDINRVIALMEKMYPVDASTFKLPEDDCVNGARFFRAEQSKNSSRVFKRLDRQGDRTPYYEYRDSAMSKLAPFRPEWIKQLRVVQDNDPHNPDVAYNNGHSLHQITLFVGPVNFYWEVQGKKYCREMNTGDSNYITPLWPHSFTTRDDSQEAYILAVTYGGEIFLSQKEISQLQSRALQYRFDYRDHSRATQALLLQFMNNACLNQELLQTMLDQRTHHVDLKQVFAADYQVNLTDLQALASCLQIEVSDLMIPVWDPQDEVVVKAARADEAYLYPNQEQALYRINPMAKTSKMPLMQGACLEVLADQPDLSSNPLRTSLHSWIYNFGQSPVQMIWEMEGEQHSDELQPNDSVYLQPWINYAFAKKGDQPAQLCQVRTSGAITLSTQKELSYLSDIERVIQEKTCWFQ